MKYQDFENAFVAKLSGIAEYKNENEMWWEHNEAKITIEFLNNSIFSAKVRLYYANKYKYFEVNYLNCKLHGKYICWYEGGNKWFELDYENGKRHGKGICWHENGDKHYEEVYQNDELISCKIEGK